MGGVRAGERSHYNVVEKQERGGKKVKKAKNDKELKREGRMVRAHLLLQGVHSRGMVNANVAHLLLLLRD
jgi:hypothetical protein